jgi:hypothetical protein
MNLQDTGLKKQWKNAKINNKDHFIKHLVDLTFNDRFSQSREFSKVNSQSILKILNDYVANLQKNSVKDINLLHNIAYYAIDFDHLNILKILNTHIQLSKEIFLKSRHLTVVQSALTVIETQEDKWYWKCESAINSTIGSIHEVLIYNTLKKHIPVKKSWDNEKLLEIIRKTIVVKSPVFELLLNDYKEYCNEHQKIIIAYSIIFSNTVSLKILLTEFPDQKLDFILNSLKDCKITREIMDILITFFSTVELNLLELLIKHNIYTYIYVIEQLEHHRYYGQSNGYYLSKYYDEAKYYEDENFELNEIHNNILYLLTLIDSNKFNMTLEKDMLKLFDCLLSEKDFDKIKELLRQLNPSVKFTKDLTAYLLTIKNKCFFLNDNIMCLDCEDSSDDDLIRWNDCYDLGCDDDNFFVRKKHVNYNSCQKNHEKWNSDESFKFFSDTLSLLVTIGGNNLRDVIKKYIPDIINFYINNRVRIKTLLSIINIDKEFASYIFENLIKTTMSYNYYYYGISDMMFVTIKHYNPDIFRVNLTCDTFLEQLYSVSKNSKKYDRQLENYYLNNDYYNFELIITWINIVLTSHLPNDVILLIIALYRSLVL